MALANFYNVLHIANRLNVFIQLALIIFSKLRSRKCITYICSNGLYFATWNVLYIGMMYVNLSFKCLFIRRPFQVVAPSKSSTNLKKLSSICPDYYLNVRLDWEIQNYRLIFLKLLFIYCYQANCNPFSKVHWTQADSRENLLFISIDCFITTIQKSVSIL